MKLAQEIHTNIKRLQFDRFWSLVSYKVARKDALKAWCQVISTQEDVDLCLRNHPLWEQEWRSWGKRCSPPYPATYLRREQWREPPPWAQERPQPGPPVEEVRRLLKEYGPEATRKWLEGMHIDAQAVLAGVSEDLEL